MCFVCLFVCLVGCLNQKAMSGSHRPLLVSNTVFRNLSLSNKRKIFILKHYSVFPKTAPCCPNPGTDFFGRVWAV